MVRYGGGTPADDDADAARESTIHDAGFGSMDACDGLAASGARDWSLQLLLLEVKWADFARSDQVFPDVVNIAVLVAFAVDYVIELVLAHRRLLYVHSKWPSALIVVSQATSLVPGLAGFGALRGLRAAPLLRLAAVLLRFLAIGGAAANDGRSLLRKHAARFALSMAGGTWLTSAVASLWPKTSGSTAGFHSFGDALWWSAATITTVGYGDV